MRMPPLLADFIYNRVCELKCEKFLTLPLCWQVDQIGISGISVINKLYTKKTRLEFCRFKAGCSTCKRLRPHC